MTPFAQGKFVATTCIALIVGSANQAWSQRSAKQESLDIAKVLDGHHLCFVGNDSVQFVNDNELVLLAGPDAICYQTVQSLELVVVTKDGRVLARKPWPSTYPFVALSSSRIAIAGSGEITVLDDRLRKVQAIPLPDPRSTIALEKEGSDTLLARASQAGDLAYSGIPLAPTKRFETAPDDRLVYVRESGDVVLLRKLQLVTFSKGATDKSLADLSWLLDCNKFCQSWSSVRTWTASQNGKRAVFTSSGSRFPVTDESGLFPLYRLVVIDLATGKEVYRKEFDTNTAKRSAQLSPSGDVLLMRNGDELRFQSIN